MNRLLKRRVPEVHYGVRRMGIPVHLSTASLYEGASLPYPQFPNDGADGYRIALDSALFAYDSTGMTGADNGSARVSRSYYPNGLLRTETQRIRTMTGDDFSRHVYEIGYDYDLNGRRKVLRHPAGLAPSATQNQTRYGYHPETGVVDEVVDPLNGRYSFTYKPRGETDTYRLPGNISEAYAYDDDGRLAAHRVTNASTSPERYTALTLRLATLRYDARGKLLSTENGVGTRDTLTAKYSGLGHVVQGQSVSHGYANNGNTARSVSGETLQHDALANMLRQEVSSSYATAGNRDRSMSSRVYGYARSNGRLARIDTPWQRDTTYYDAAGNAEFTTQSAFVRTADADLTDVASFYAADSTLRAAERRTVADPNIVDGGFYSQAFEEYRYDALGRRVWVRARQHCQNAGPNALCGISRVRRTVWDGDQEFYEIQMPGEDGSPDLERDVEFAGLRLATTDLGYKVDPNPLFGRVAYTHGPAVDQPLGIVRMNYGDKMDESNQEVPHRALPPFVISPVWDERGQAHLGVFEDGGARKCEGTGTTKRCVYPGWPETWFAYVRPQFSPTFWHGTLLQAGRHGHPLPAQPLLRPVHRAVHPGRPDRPRGRAERLRLRRGRPRQLW